MADLAITWTEIDYEITLSETAYGITLSEGESTPVPENAILNADGSPLTNADGSYILTD
jgi:hypothetical protein